VNIYTKNVQLLVNCYVLVITNAHSEQCEKKCIYLYFVFLIFFIVTALGTILSHYHQIIIEYIQNCLCSKLLFGLLSYSHLDTVLLVFIKSLFAYYVFVTEYIRKYMDKVI